MPEHGSLKSIGHYLKQNRAAKLLEIIAVFLAAFVFIFFLLPLAGDNPVYRQAVVWFANILMLALVWAGLRLRGESWESFGLSFKFPGWKRVFNTFLLSLLVLVIALAGFILGSIIMANITGIPENADMSGYAFLKDNFGMLILTLIGVFIVSSFGEEVLYRAFLINRLTEIGSDSRNGRIIAVIISAVIFGLVHYSWGPMGIVQTGFMGLALGICYLVFKKRLWILILAHAYMDTALMVQMYLAGN